jgi:hypothetical protein
VDAEADHGIDELQQDKAADERKYPRDENAQPLHQELAGVAKEQPVPSGLVDRFGGEQTGGQGAPRPPDAVNADHVQRVVVPRDFRLHAL